MVSVPWAWGISTRVTDCASPAALFLKVCALWPRIFYPFTPAQRTRWGYTRKWGKWNNLPNIPFPGGERWALRCYTTRYGEHADSRFCLGSLCMLGSSSRTENHCFQWPHLCASVQVPVPGGVGASALYSCTFVQQGQKFLGETQSSPSGIFGRLLGITLASSGTRLHGFCVIQYQAINYFCNIFC